MRLRFLSSFLPLLTSNWISSLGALVTTTAFIGMAVSFVLISVGAWGGPYAGLVVFLVLPGIFVGGLAVIPLGLFLYRKTLKDRILARKEAPVNILKTVGVLTVVNLVVLSLAGFQGLHYMDSVEFCGTLCHTVMRPQYEAFLSSPHARVPCVECHIGPGASWFVKSKLSGLRQVFAVLFDTYRKPIPTPVENLRPARETCEQCHWPEKFQGERLVVKRVFLPDREATPFTNLLLMKTGGLRRDGTPVGIHWHVYHKIRVSYVATDRKRERIPWVRMEDGKGEVRIFTAPGADPMHPPEGESRIMDCVDCHNQPSHVFHDPADEIDRSIGIGRISRKLPFIKKTALEALRKPWTRKNYAEGIKKTLEHFYTRKEPIPASAIPLLEGAARELARIWKRNIYPEMGITWGTYRSRTDHRGCNRCHDGKHRDSRGRAIPNNCETCHILLYQGRGTPSLLERLGLEAGKRDGKGGKKQ